MAVWYCAVRYQNISENLCLSRDDLVNIMANLQHGTVRNIMVNRDKINLEIMRFIERGRELRQEVLQVAKERETNSTERAVVASPPAQSRAIIYNRINKSGSTSFLCK